MYIPQYIPKCHVQLNIYKISKENRNFLYIANTEDRT